VAPELFVGLEQRSQQVFLAAHAAQMVTLAEFLDGRRIVEQVGKDFGVCRAGGRVGIVLHHVERPVGEVRIQARGDFRHLITGIDGGQHLLGRQQFHAGQEAGAIEHHALHAVDGADEGSPVFTRCRTGGG
jgi:hypothetical protein